MLFFSIGSFLLELVTFYQEVISTDGSGREQKQVEWQKEQQ
jgi:hypothetical protein